MPRPALSVVALMLFLGLGGCTANESAAAPSRDVSSSIQSADPNEAVSQSAPTAPRQAPLTEDEFNAAASAPVVPDPAHVAARFEGIQPTQWGLEVPGVLTRMDSDGIALTLDACGGPYGSGYDAELINGLIDRGVPATLFLNQRWIEANLDLARKLAQNPLFEIANHGTQHRPLSVRGESAYGIAGTGSALEAAEEVWANHLAITELTGKAPRFFRSGTAHYDDVAVQIAQEFDEGVLGFTVNADAGATFDAATVRGQVADAQPGSVIIAHMNQPQGQTAQGVLAGVDDLLARGQRMSFVENPY